MTIDPAVTVTARWVGRIGKFQLKHKEKEMSDMKARNQLRRKEFRIRTSNNYPFSLSQSFVKAMAGQN
jgi:hypothetical protein